MNYFNDSDSDEIETVDVGSLPGLSMTIQNPNDSYNLYNTHNNIFCHYMDLSRSQGRITDKLQLTTKSFQKIDNFLHPQCNLNQIEAKQLRQKWVDRLAQECVESKYVPQYIIVCPADEDVIYCKIIKQYLKYLRYEHSLLSKATFICMPRFYMTNLLSTSYCYYNQSNDSQQSILFYENHVDFISYDMTFPTSLSLKGINMDSYTRTHRFYNPYEFEQMCQVQDLSKELKITNMVFFLGKNKERQISVAKCFAIDHFVTMLFDGNETKGYEYLQRLVQFSNLFDKFSESTDPNMYKMQKLYAIWICWKGFEPFNFIEKWAKKSKDGSLTGIEAWNIYNQYVNRDKERKKITGLEW
ncbi:Hypothetical_protein [Hexamita inflata]|uniref:Hypothetical_protein n=1 Tax=Hexamita inflata TaxID=28002 RepID=A0AA86V276_9EUKA|nr:Hypothetical protein HINF_LOCUS48455 [Hexamita inflata]CAI9973287.1 Hypothetical protein HINF_LOCUS60932 [Hexamita inflata]